MSQLLNALICDEISLNEFKQWFESQDSDQNLLENTSKYEFIAYLLTSIRSSTNWLFKTSNKSSSNQNCDNFMTNQFKSELNTNVIKSDQNIEYLKQKRNIITENVVKVKALTTRIEKIDLNDENAFPGLSSAPNVPKLSHTIVQKNETPVLVSAVQSRRTKRIKPTTIRGDDRVSVGFFISGRKDQMKGKQNIRKDFVKSSDNFGSNQSSFENNSNDSLLAEREWLKRGKSQQIHKVFDNTRTPVLNPVSNQLPMKQEFNRLVAIEAKPDCLTFTTELDLISKVYSLVLCTNSVSNFTEEFKFICHLFSKRVFCERNEQIDNKFNEYLSSYHNCMYFTVKCLEHLLITYNLIQCLNKTILKHLIESIVLLKFDSNLRQLISIAFETQNKNLPKNDLKSITTLDSVLFQSETDNKSHFPNDNSFHSFRRQRDEFYKIFNFYRNRNTAEQSPQITQKDINLKFGNSVKHLMSLATDSANLSHLTRLFVSQLMQSCVQKHLNMSLISYKPQNSDNETTTDDNESVAPLGADSERLKKLRKRFHQSKSQSNSFCDRNVFVKEEMFFRDFIFYGDSHAFNENLKILLSDKILSLYNNFDIFNNDFDSESGDDTQELIEKIRNNLFTIKLLAKFLGFTQFYPFDTKLNNNYINDFVDTQTRLRTLQTKPSIDFEEYIRFAIKSQKLLTTIPWITEFLSFIDPISARIGYYENIYKLFVVIYRTLVPKITQTVSINGFFLGFCLSKTLSNKNFDYENRFYKFLFSTSTFDNTNNLSVNTRPAFDSMNNLIDSKFFNEFHSNLSSELMEIFKQNVISNEVKKITPLSLPSINTKQKNCNNIEINSEKQLRLQIEEQFFNSHSPSLRKTVEFVSDRITSKTIRRIKIDIYVKFKVNYIESFEFNYNNFDENQLDFYNITQDVQKQCLKFADDYCRQQIQTIFPLLMNEDIDESVSDFAAKISLKLTADKCFDWINKNITQNLIETDLKSELKKKMSTNQQKVIENKEELVDISPAFTSVRDLMGDLYKCEPLEFEPSVVVKLINDLTHLRRSKALPKRTIDFIDVNITDFLMSLIANKPILLNESVIKLFIDYWQEFRLIVDKLICPRNLYILSEKTKNPIQSWNKYETIIIKMLSNNLTTIKIIESDTLWTLKQEWSDLTLKRFGSCLKSVFDYQKSHQMNDTNSESTESATIDWLSWFCSQSD